MQATQPKWVLDFQTKWVLDFQTTSVRLHSFDPYSMQSCRIHCRLYTNVTYIHQPWSKHNVTFWRPDCPTNYLAVGDVMTVNDSKNETVKPDKTDASCIHKDFITQDQLEMQHLRTMEADKRSFDTRQRWLFCEISNPTKKNPIPCNFFIKYFFSK